MPKPSKRAKKKARSDIFIYRLESGGYSAHPSPFIIQPGLDQIQFRNLTDTTISLRLKGVPVSPSTLSIRANARGLVRVNPSAKAGIYEYKARVATAPADPRVARLPKTYAQGTSSPKMIVDA